MLSIEASRGSQYTPLCALGWPVPTLSVSPRQGVRASLWSWELLSWLDWWGEGASSGCCGWRGRLPAGSRALSAGPPHPVHATHPRLVPPSSSHTTYSPLTPSTLLILSPSGRDIGQSLPSLGREVPVRLSPPRAGARGGLPRSRDILLERQQKGIPQLFIERRTLLGGASHQAPSPERLIGR